MGHESETNRAVVGSNRPSGFNNQAIVFTRSFTFESRPSVKAGWHAVGAGNVTLYFGHGSGYAVAGGELLSTVLAQHPDDIRSALGEWERQLRPHIETERKAAHREKNFFLPGSRIAKVLRGIFIQVASNLSTSVITRKLYQAVIKRAPKQVRQSCCVAISEGVIPPVLERGVLIQLMQYVGLDWYSSIFDLRIFAGR